MMFAAMGSMEKLTVLMDSLEQGGDPDRLYAAQAAYNFKHSWLEMAQALVEVRNRNQFVKWGFDDFLDYCQRELGLKRVVVDKLTASYYVLKRVVPERLETAREDAPIPSYQALDYYSRATGEVRMDGNPARDAPQQELSPELSGQLYDAVFNQRCSQKQLRDRFDPLIRPKSAAREQQEVNRKALNSARKLLQLVEEVEGLSNKTLQAVQVAVSGLEVEIEAHLERLKQELARSDDDTP